MAWYQEYKWQKTNIDEFHSSKLKTLGLQRTSSIKWKIIHRMEESISESYIWHSRYLYLEYIYNFYNSITESQITQFKNKCAKALNRPFSKEYGQMANKPKKSSLASLAIREMQSNHNERHFTPSKMLMMKKTENNTCWWGCEEVRTPTHRWWSCKTSLLLWKTAWQFLKRWHKGLPMTQDFHWKVCTQEKWEHMFRQEVVHGCLEHY